MYLWEDSHIVRADSERVSEVLHSLLQPTDLVQDPLLALLQVAQSWPHRLGRRSMQSRHTQSRESERESEREEGERRERERERDGEVERGGERDGEWGSKNGREKSDHKSHYLVARQSQ